MNKNQSNSKQKIQLKEKRYIYSLNNSMLNFQSISRFIQFVNSLTLKLPIVLELRNVDVFDKLSYVLLECLCQHLIKERNMKIGISLSPKKTIFVEGIASSPLNILLGTPNRINCENYLKRFCRGLYATHYRRLIELDDNKSGIAASKVSSEIETFLKVFNVEEEYINEVIEVLGELIDNAMEHSESDCLIDVDVTKDHLKQGDPDGKYYGVNIAILSLSETLIGDRIKEIYHKSENNSRYEKLENAYGNHTNFWNDNYTEDDFFIMSAFQHGISGRGLISNTGGTGLTQLISVLESKSDAYNCYMISGDRILRFQQDLLKQDENFWVGFNDEHDFINYPPKVGAFISSPLFFPGVAYNLNFVLKKEQNNE